jgi:small subunit ribosomal protein S16
MPVKIRLKKMGTKSKPHFKIVVCDQHKARGSSTIEDIGYYDPSKNPPLVKIDKERANYWTGVGAILSDTVKSILKRA